MLIEQGYPSIGAYLMLSEAYTSEERTTMLSIAERSIEHGLAYRAALPVKAVEFSPRLRRKRACFVTLRSSGELRGCTGSIVARHPLIRCVSEHAYSSAFLDQRFMPLGWDELKGLAISISILSDMVPIDYSDEAELVAELRPGVDGLVLEYGRALATLLPSVWRSLPDPVEFMRQLKRKAGLAGDFWSGGIRVSRYTTEEFGASE